MTMLDASGYIYNQSYYFKEFERLLEKVVLCYKFMINDDIKVPSNDENIIRDRLLIDYLKNNKIRNEINLTNYLFDREVYEDSKKCEKVGRTDIKIQTKNTFTDTSAYYIIECKRIDNENLTGISGLNAKYIVEGINRFITKQYSSYYSTNGMIGFIVESIDIHANVTKINSLLKNNFKEVTVTREIQKTHFIPEFDYQYTSQHLDCDNKEIVLYHLMFDFSNHIEE